MGQPAFKQPEQLQIELLPGMADVFDEVEELLGRDACDAFREDLLAGFLESLRTMSDRPLNDAVQSWYRTLVMKRRGVDKQLANLPDLAAEEPLTFDEVRQLING